ncbi:MAG: GNAT family N-acetyltransferase, partial [Acidimicrobiia bacterium]
VPGGTLPMAGTTIVTVQPTHRRQGVLTKMMGMHLEQAIEREQPLAGLWASESAIYGRFGYGPATYAHDLTVPTDRVGIPEGPATDTVRLIDADDAFDVLPAIYDEVRSTLPGTLSRSEAWWKHRRLRDPEHWREGGSSRRIAVARRGDRAVGYVTYRQKEKWEGMVAEGTVEVIEVIAFDDDARRSLWHYLSTIDLFPNVHWWNAPADYPLLVEAGNPRRITVKPYDTLWLRILDVPRALAGRIYEADGSIKMRILDDYLGRGGTVHLTISGGIATCVETTDDADVTMSIADLGALYLGRPASAAMWHAGRIEGSQASVRTLDRLFRTAELPFCSEVF